MLQISSHILMWISLILITSPRNTYMASMLYLREQNRALEKFSDLFEVMQLSASELGNQNYICSTCKPSSSPAGHIQGQGPISPSGVPYGPAATSAPASLFSPTFLLMSLAYS